MPIIRLVINFSAMNTSFAAVGGLDDEQKSRAADACAESRSHCRDPSSQAVGGRTEICCGRTRTAFFPVQENSILFSEEKRDFDFLDSAGAVDFCFTRCMSV